MTNQKHDPLLDETETSAMLGNSVGTLRNWRCSGLDGPDFVKIGRLVRYRLSDIERYIESKTVRVGVSS